MWRLLIADAASGDDERERGRDEEKTTRDECDYKKETRHRLTATATVMMTAVAKVVLSIHVHPFVRLPAMPACPATRLLRNMNCK